ncbi:unnamed protein product [Urochloa humidicola]
MDSSSPLVMASLSPESMVAAPKDGDSEATKDGDSSPLDSEMVMDSVPPEMELTPASSGMKLSPASSEMVVAPESLPPGAFLCNRCGLIHEDRQSWNRAHSLRWPCSRCGLIHRDYDLSATIYGLDKFDCEIFIPDVDNVVMDGETIILPAHVLKLLDEKCERDQAAAKEDTKALQM